MASQNLVPVGRPRNVRPLRIEGVIAFVTLTRGLVSVIDAIDAELIGKRNWYAAKMVDGRFYAAASYRVAQGRDVHTSIHREILGLGLGEYGDHIDRDSLNNRRNNLRKCTTAQNAANRAATIFNPLGLKGVTRGKNGKFDAMIGKDGKTIFLGAYNTPEEAAAAYAGAARALNGRFAWGAADDPEH